MSALSPIYVPAERLGRTRARHIMRCLDRACCEVMERRVHLSTTVTQLGQRLVIVGDQANDIVQVTDLGGGSVTVTSSVAQGQPTTLSFKGVARVVVDTGAGDDQVTYSATGGGGGAGGAIYIDHFVRTLIGTGAGNDRVHIKYDNVGGDVTSMVSLGDGNDSCDVSFTGTPNPDSVAHYVKFSVDAGAGDDSVHASFSNVFTQLSATMGAGSDLLAVTSSYDKSSPKLCEAVMNVSMGGGGDRFSLSATGTGDINGDGLSDDRVYLKYDGGNGSDSVQASFFDVFTELSLAGGAGNDAFTIKHDGVVGSSSISADMGAGADLFDLTANSSLGHAGYVPPPGASPDSLYIKFSGSDGDDTAKVSLVDVLSTVSLDGGVGADTLQLQCDTTHLRGLRPAGVLDDLNLSVSGGDGADSVLIGLLLPAVQQSAIGTVASLPLQVSVSIDGGRGADSVQLDASGGDNAAFDSGDASRIYLKIDGGAGNDSFQASFFDVFTEVTFDGGAGSDSIFIKLDGIKGDCVVDASGGAGNDIFTVSANSSVQHKGFDAARFTSDALFIKIDGGDGSDTVTAAISDVFTDSNLDLGTGNDAVFIKIDGLVQGESSLSINLGDGNDRCTVSDSSVSPDSPPISAVSFPFTKIVFKMDGGTGNDTMRASFFDVFTDFSLDGGEGADRAYIKYDGIKGESLFNADMGDGSDALEVTSNSSALHQGFVASSSDAAALFIKYDGGAGDDSVAITSSDVFTDMSLDGGDGSDRFVIKCSNSDLLVGQAPPDMTVGLALSVTGGAGSDSILIGLSMPSLQTACDMDVSVDMGDGFDALQMDVAGPPASSIAPPNLHLSVDGGASSDSASLSFADVFCDVSMDMGGGSDRGTIKFGHQQFQSASSVRVDMGAGNDIFDLSAGDAASAPQSGLPRSDDSLALRYDGGEGDDTASVSFHHLFLAASLDGGNGNDTLVIKGETCDDGNLSTHPSDMFSDLDLSVSGGMGNDSIQLSLTLPAVQTDRSADVTIDLGEDSNSLQLDIVGSSSTSPAVSSVQLRVAGGSSDDVVNGSMTDAVADAIIETGAGNDSVTFDNLNVNGSLQVSTGDGSDFAHVTNARTDGGRLSALIALLDGGDGLDTGEVSKAVDAMNVEDLTFLP